MTTVDDLPVSTALPVPPHPPGVLAACDGSDGSLWALDRAMTEAELHGLPLYVLGVVNPSPDGRAPAGLADLMRESAAHLTGSMGDGLRRAVATVQRARPRPYTGACSVHVGCGPAIEVLLTAAAGHHTLVLGARGNGGFSRLLLGSVSTAAAHHAACPVLIVPAPPGR